MTMNVTVEVNSCTISGELSARAQVGALACASVPRCRVGAQWAWASTAAGGSGGGPTTIATLVWSHVLATQLRVVANLEGPYCHSGNLLFGVSPSLLGLVGRPQTRVLESTGHHTHWLTGAHHLNLVCAAPPDLPVDSCDLEDSAGLGAAILPTVSWDLRTAASLQSVELITARLPVEYVIPRSISTKSREALSVGDDFWGAKTMVSSSAVALWPLNAIVSKPCVDAVYGSCIALASSRRGPMGGPKCLPRQERTTDTGPREKASWQVWKVKEDSGEKQVLPPSSAKAEMQISWISGSKFIVCYSNREEGAPDYEVWDCEEDSTEPARPLKAVELPRSHALDTMKTISESFCVIQVHSGNRIVVFDALSGFRLLTVVVPKWDFLGLGINTPTFSF